MTKTGNAGLDALADAIAERVLDRINADQQPLYISAKELARRLGRSVRTIHYMAHTGIIPVERHGKRLAFRWPEVQRKLEIEAGSEAETSS